MRRALVLVLLVGTGLAPLGAGSVDDPTRILPVGQLPRDSRLGKPKDLNGCFPFSVPSTKSAWEARRKQLREQILVATGLWPMPEKMPLNPVIHGKIDRDAYTVEKVFFTSCPGHYVSGSLYRPKAASGKVPGVLCPHGHWQNGRFYDAGEAAARKQIEAGAEKTIEGARYPLQARCAQLARMGCVVLHYDMVGVADSQPIGHAAGFTDAEAELRLQSALGLQTFNSIRALDFLLSLPEIDPLRIGVTGASGGGTQTFLLCAVDDRPTVAFPAVMVGTAMQGGCICENASYLRQETGNVEIAGLFAPKPLAMSGANDWTIDIEKKGLPELRALYRLYGAEDHVHARCFPQFGHNYNQVSREFMYPWFNQHLHLGQPTPVVEKPFQPIPPGDLSVFDAQHPRPADAADASTLRRWMTASLEKQLAALRPDSPNKVARFQEIVGTALRVMLHDQLPAPGAVEPMAVATKKSKGIEVQKLILGRRDSGEQLPALLLRPEKRNGNVVVWIHPAGKLSLYENGELVPAARVMLQRHTAILAPDVFMTGEFVGTNRPPVDPRFAGYTFGYNRPLLANQVHDVLTAVAYARGLGENRVDLVGWERAGPWVLLGRAMCGAAVRRTAADAHRFRFEHVTSTQDPMMLPGALKYGGLPAAAALCAPGELYVWNEAGTGIASFANAAYQAAGQPKSLCSEEGKPDMIAVVDFLSR